MKKSAFVNVICNGSPSRMRMTRRISFGMTTLPRSSILLTIPVAFVFKIPFTLQICTVSICKARGFILSQPIIQAALLFFVIVGPDEAVRLRAVIRLDRTVGFNKAVGLDEAVVSGVRNAVEHRRVFFRSPFGGLFLSVDR